jgi:hypothetical protein
VYATRRGRRAAKDGALGRHRGRLWLPVPLGERHVLRYVAHEVLRRRRLPSGAKSLALHSVESVSERAEGAKQAADKSCP